MVEEQSSPDDENVVVWMSQRLTLATAASSCLGPDPFSASGYLLITTDQRFVPNAFEVLLDLLRSGMILAEQPAMTLHRSV